MTTIFEVLHRKAEPYKVTLARGQKGTYGWEITVSSSSLAALNEILERVDSLMRMKYGGEKNG